jgi:hypothetical protein
MAHNMATIKRQVVENFHRQRDIFDPSTVTQKRIHVIGCGTIGSWVTLGLHKLGVTNVILWDFDTVEDLNIPSQAFESGDINKNKARVLGERYGYGYRECEYNYHLELQPLNETIFVLCVDSLEARRAIIGSLPLTAIVIDGRMGGEGYEVHYGTASSIIVPESASEEECTAKGIVYLSMGIAAEMVATIKQLLTGVTPDYAIRYRDYRGGDTLSIKPKV